MSTARRLARGGRSRELLRFHDRVSGLVTALTACDRPSCYASPAGTKGQLLTWVKNGRIALAGYALWLIAETWASEGNPVRPPGREPRPRFKPGQ